MVAERSRLLVAGLVLALCIGCGGRPKNLPFVRKVTFVTSDSVRIAGTFYESQTKASPAVLLLHTYDRDRSDWDEFAKAVYKAGYNVLSIDLRGHGESVYRIVKEGKKEKEVKLSLNTDKDLLAMPLDEEAAMEFLRSQWGVDSKRVGIVGASIGANLGVLYAASDANKKIKVRCLVLLSPGLDYRGLKIEEAIGACKDRPILTIAGAGDDYSAFTVRKLDEILKSPAKKMMLYSTAEHGTQFLEDRPEVGKLIVQYLDQNLKSAAKE